MDKSALKEPVQHGNDAFPFQAYPGFYNSKIMLQPPRSFYGHWHEEMEVIWMPEAGGTLIVDGQALECRPRSVFFIHPGEIHSWDSHSKKSERAVAFVFHWRLLDLLGGAVRDKYLQPMAQGRLKLPRMLCADGGWKQSVCDDMALLVEEAASKKPGSELAVMARLYSILAKVALAGALRQADPGDSSRAALKLARIKKALQYIFDHYAGKISVKDLAGAAGLSSFHFCRQFKAVMNQTPVNYLNRYRVDRAAELLRDPERKILETSLDVGFTHLSYFIKTFKRLQHCTPSEYRAASRSELGKKGRAAAKA